LGWTPKGARGRVPFKQKKDKKLDFHVKILGGASRRRTGKTTVTLTVDHEGPAAISDNREPYEKRGEKSRGKRFSPGNVPLTGRGEHWRRR